MAQKLWVMTIASEEYIDIYNEYRYSIEHNQNNSQGTQGTF